MTLIERLRAANVSRPSRLILPFTCAWCGKLECPHARTQEWSRRSAECGELSGETAGEWTIDAHDAWHYEHTRHASYPDCCAAHAQQQME